MLNNIYIRHKIAHKFGISYLMPYLCTCKTQVTTFVDTAKVQQVTKFCKRYLTYWTKKFQEGTHYKVGNVTDS